MCTLWSSEAWRELSLLLCRAEVNGLYERLFFENVLTELGESSEIIYLSVANAALAHLPYLVALDHQSRQGSPVCLASVLPLKPSESFIG